MRRFSEISAGRDEVGAVLAELETRTAALEGEQQIITSVEVDEAEPATPFIVGYIRKKDKIKPICSYNVPLNIEHLNTVFIETANRDTDEHFQIREEADGDIDFGDSTPVSPIDFNGPWLHYGTQYDLLKTVAEGSTLGKVKNPSSGPARTDPPLAQFTTPVRFNAPSTPNAAQIVRNRLNPVTADVFDADLVVKIYAPLTDAGAAQTWEASGADVVEPEFDICDAPTFITGATNANPIVITSAAHGLNTGDETVISGVGGTTSANGRWTVTKLSSNTFSIPAAGNGVYTSLGMSEKVIDKTKIHRKIKSTDTLIDATTTPPNQGYVDAADTVPAGQHWQWRKTTIHAGGDMNSATASPPVDIFTGNVKKAQSGIPELTSTSFSTGTGDGENKHIPFQFNFTQPTPAVGLLKYKLSRYLTSDYSDTEKKLRKHTLRLDEYNTSGAQILDFGYVKVKPGADNYFRLTIHSTSGTTRVFDFTNTASAKVTVGLDGNVPSDTARPATPSAPICTPGVNNGDIKAEAEVPASQTATIVKYRFAMSTSGTAPDRDSPAEGVDGVVKLKKGHLFVTFQRPQTDISATTFFFFVQALNSIGWSEWSSPTTVLGSTIKRPLQDMIGTSVAVFTMGLLASGTAPASPANDTTHYNINTGDAHDYQVDITAGKSIFLMIQSLGATDVIRKASAYSLADHRFTVSVAYNSTPGVSLEYEIHLGLTLGEKSGTGHTMTTINLGTAGLLLPDGVLIGSSVYMPSQPSADGDGDQIRRITAHAAGVISFAVVAGALTNGACYAVSQGSWGHAAINPLSGIISAVPERPWYFETKDQNILELIPPTGEDAFSINEILVDEFKKSNGVFKQAYTFAPSIRSSYSMRAPGSYAPVYVLSIVNLATQNVGNGRGVSLKTVYLLSFQSGAADGYDPATNTPVTVDNRAPASYPTSEFPAYG